MVFSHSVPLRTIQAYTHQSRYTKHVCKHKTFFVVKSLRHCLSTNSERVYEFSFDAKLD